MGGSGAKQSSAAANRRRALRSRRAIGWSSSATSDPDDHGAGCSPGRPDSCSLRNHHRIRLRNCLHTRPGHGPGRNTPAVLHAIHCSSRCPRSYLRAPRCRGVRYDAPRRSAAIACWCSSRHARAGPACGLIFRPGRGCRSRLSWSSGHSSGYRVRCLPDRFRRRQRLGD